VVRNYWLGGMEEESDPDYFCPDWDERSECSSADSSPTKAQLKARRHQQKKAGIPRTLEEEVVK